MIAFDVQFLECLPVLANTMHKVIFDPRATKFLCLKFLFFARNG